MQSGEGTSIAGAGEARVRASEPVCELASLIEAVFRIQETSSRELAARVYDRSA